jgi:hypothetical protein
MKMAQMKEKEMNKLYQYVFVIDALESKLISGEDNIKFSKVLNTAATAITSQYNEMFYFY